jgi:hypothetical protein
MKYRRLSLARKVMAPLELVSDLVILMDTRNLCREMQIVNRSAAMAATGTTNLLF